MTKRRLVTLISIMFTILLLPTHLPLSLKHLIEEYCERNRPTRLHESFPVIFFVGLESVSQNQCE